MLDLGRYIAMYPRKRIDDCLDAIANLSERTMFGPGYETALAANLRSIVEAQEPASVIRLGDGEGNVLAVGNSEFPAAYALGARRIMGLMFGRRIFSAEELDELRAGMERAILEADVVGIPDKHRIATCYRGTELRPFPVGTVIDVRGTLGSLDAVRLTSDLLSKSGHRLKIVTNCYLHRDLLPLYSMILSGLPFVGIISCYPGIDSAVTAAFGVKSTQLYRIPEQAANIGRQPDSEHYPARFNEIISSLRVPDMGAVFLVAAGILGKLYCTRIKELGGIAIDIGSVADVWMGQSSRLYHSPEYLQKWHLGESINAAPGGGVG
jgi:hypothetical protein